MVQCSWHPNSKAYPATPNHLFPVPPGTEVGYGRIKLHEALFTQILINKLITKLCIGEFNGRRL